MQCEACRLDNPPQNRFCDQCGAPLAAVCPSCGGPVRPEARFCGVCGKRLGAEPGAGPAGSRAPAPLAYRSPVATYTPRHLADKILRSRSAIEGERRQVTVLFADIAGFTTLAEKIDPEDVHRIVDRCFDLITAEVHRFEGTINQYTGDGVMALFGAPIAHEDSPRRAVHAALAIQRAIRDYDRERQAQGGLPLQMRIGLHTGPVVVGKIGDDLRMDYTAVGDTTNLASRLQQAARPGSVVVSEATHAALGGFFETLDLGETAVKGRAPARIFEVLRARARRSRLAAAVERGLTRLVGRSREVGSLLERFAEVKAGHGQIVSLAGDAGIGKSRLLLEFRRAAMEGDDRPTWLEGQCVSFGQSIPFLPLIEQLRLNFHVEEFDGEPEIIAKVEHAMRRMGELEPHIPYVRYLLSVDPGDRGVLDMEAGARRRKCFEALRALSLRGARLRPLVLVFEDLHWSDAGTEEYLASMADAVASVPLMLILTYRVGYAPPVPARSFHTALTLHALSQEDAVTMARHLLGADDLPPAVRQALLDKAEGVPLFIEEVTKTLLDLGTLRREGDGYRVAEGAGTLDVPDTIQGIIMARLDRLGEDGKRTVQLASVIGRQFLGRLLQRVAGLTERLPELLEELKELEIIYELALAPEPAYIFKHALIQDVAYQSLLRERRRELHRAVGMAIEEIYADRLAEHAEELAHHFQNGGEWQKAFTYLVRSGDRAKAAYANQTALDLYARALEASARSTPPPAPALIMDVHHRRGVVLRLLARYPDSIAEFERMGEVARSGGDRIREGEALVEIAYSQFLTFNNEAIGHCRRFAQDALAIGRETADQHVVARSLCYLGLAAQADGEVAEGDRLFEESLGIARAGGFADTVAVSLTWLGAHANWRGEFARAIETSRQAGAAARAINDGLSELLALAFACLSQIGLGEYTEALATIDDGLAKARDRNNSFIVGRLTNTLGWLYQELGDFRRATEYNREAAEIGRRTKNANVEVSSLINLGLDELYLGDARRALALMEETQDRVEKHAFGAHRWRWSNHLSAYLSEALLAIGDPARALEQADKAFRQARATGSVKYQAKALALRGQILLDADEREGASRELGEAVALARRIGYPTLTWQAAHLLARAHAAGGRPDQAVAAARLAADTLDQIASRLPDAASRRTFLAWPRVDTVREDVERLLRG
ncbi:MAG TPA: adenylate/guanylate cyclase domain-containing protein [Methylomirabilota bacterium]|jgi:class 3 adenylate cyclase/tetratricopeptide (TPR) repeat protein